MAPEVSGQDVGMNEKSVEDLLFIKCNNIKQCVMCIGEKNIIAIAMMFCFLL